jgi:hypothetical protein
MPSYGRAAAISDSAAVSATRTSAGNVFHADFPHDSGAMTVHGALAYVQVRRNVLACSPCENEV